MLDRPAGPQDRSLLPSMGTREQFGSSHLGPADAAKPLMLFLEVMRLFGLNVGPSA